LPGGNKNFNRLGHANAKPTRPRFIHAKYTIRYLDDILGWQESSWKMRVPYAYKQYAMKEGDPVWDSEEFFTPGMVVAADVS
jgi:hypothetical protein